MSEAALPLIAIAGNPNCGKTALFNALTGSHQKVGNYAGVTVERKEGRLHTPSGAVLKILDLPGTYSLNARTPDEAIARKVILGQESDVQEPEYFIAVADATNLERSLGLVLELRSTGKPLLLALNMMDLAKKRGLELDLHRLSQELKIPVIPTVATTHDGIRLLVQAIEQELSGKHLVHPGESASALGAATPQGIRARFAEVDRILKASLKRPAQNHALTDQIDRIVLHPVWGSLFLAGILLLIFQSVFNWAGPLQDTIKSGIELIGQIFRERLPEGPLQSLLVDGVIAGVGSVLVFLPQILLLFTFILLLEDTGYLARAAFLMDRLMGRVGLHGRAFIPLLSSFACAIPGIMATRTIENRRDRLTTILVAPLMTCSARLPVYTLLIGAFIPNSPVLGPLRLQGLVLFTLYLGGIFSALLVASLLKKTVLAGARPPLILELPSYKLPNWRNWLFGLKQRSQVFLRRAGTVILALSIVLWFLASYPKAPEGSHEPAIASSFAGKIGKSLEPIFRPLGFDWRISVALIPGFAAREVMVGALATVYSVEASQLSSNVEAKPVDELLGAKLSQFWSLPTALSLLVWYVFALQCLSTIAVTRRETNSWRWPMIMLLYMTALAYGSSWITFHLATYLGKIGGSG